ncbi:MAG: helical backbone metal receptor [Candidatus Eremiobacteraeota bacterium]|nr:helical backbone metal receptor [Candidatus Eremiobacteraeota bacterium]
MIERLILACSLAFALASCAASNSRIDVVDKPTRIVSLMPSLTEDICRIGAGKLLVGVSQYSNGASCAAGLPVVSDFASVDAEAIIALHPAVVVGIPAQRRTTASLRSAHVPIAFFPDDTYDDIFADLTGLGNLTGHAASAKALVAKLRAQTRALQTARHFKRHPSVFIALGAGPIWTVGPRSYLSQIIALAGGRNAVSVLPSAYAQYSAEALLALQPDAIVTDRFTHLNESFDREPWRSLNAVRTRHVFVAPDDFERPGPQYNESIRWLTERLRPLAT